MLGRIALTGAMYRKLFDLSQETISKVTIGKLVNLMSYDVQRLDVVSCMFVVVLHFPILILIPTSILYIPILIPILIPIPTCILHIPIPTCTLYIPFSFCSILPSYYSHLIIMITLSFTLFSLSGFFLHIIHHPGSMSYSCGTHHNVVLP